MKVLFLLNVIGLAVGAVTAVSLDTSKPIQFCSPDKVQSSKYELDWRNSPKDSGAVYFSVDGSCQCHNKECSDASCYAPELANGEYLFCKQIEGGSCGFICSYIDEHECKNEDALCPGFATLPVKN
ncbi:hypothetical protein BGZ63DRAFT_408167 [Mariannaea sp. PMI_226]|nr:hypothetical protein BGZ63DRAFT_408167 [Mariannaea sp. PMI_226]